MASAISVYARPFRHSPATVHEHEMLSLLLLCPEEQCRRRALAVLDGSPEDPKADDQPKIDSLGWLDADERVPGHLRDPHLPSFDPRGSARVGKKQRKSRTEK